MKSLTSLVLCYLLFWSGYVIAQPASVSSILESENPVTTPSGFYIRQVTDERVEKSVGKLLLNESGRTVGKELTLDGGTSVALTRFLGSGMNRDTLLRPIDIRISECNITEIPAGEGQVTGTISVTIRFDLFKKTGSVPLTQYKTSAKYTRPLNKTDVIEPTLRRLLGNSLRFISNWMNTEIPRNLKLATAVRLTFSDYLEQHHDTVYYSPARPLTWDDFKDKDRRGQYHAEVFPSFGYDEHASLEKGIIHVKIALKVYVVKSASWAAANAKNAYNLNHEQRHFDLVKVIAERFKKKLLEENLTPDNYEGILNVEYLNFYRQMNEVQQDYDEQTSHGVVKVIQEFWNKKIDESLGELK